MTSKLTSHERENAIQQAITQTYQLGKTLDLFGYTSESDKINEALVMLEERAYKGDY